MSVDKTKVPYLKKFMTDEEIEEVNAKSKEMRENAIAQGLDFKEGTDEAPPVEETPATEEPVVEEESAIEELAVEEEAVPATEQEAETLKDDSVETPLVEADPAEAEEEVETEFTEKQVKELAGAFDAFGAGLLSQVKEIVETAVSDLVSSNEATQKEQDDLKEVIGMSPHESLVDMIVNGNTLKQNSAANSEQTEIDKRTKDAKDGPEEDMQGIAPFSGDNNLGMLNESLNDIITGKVIADNKQ